MFWLRLRLPGKKRKLVECLRARALAVRSCVWGSKATYIGGGCRLFRAPQLVGTTTATPCTGLAPASGPGGLLRPSLPPLPRAGRRPGFAEERVQGFRPWLGQIFDSGFYFSCSVCRSALGGFKQAATGRPVAHNFPGPREAAKRAKHEMSGRQRAVRFRQNERLWKSRATKLNHN